MSSKQNRLAIQQQIAAFALEMSTTTPSLKVNSKQMTDMDIVVDPDATVVDYSEVLNLKENSDSNESPSDSNDAAANEINGSNDDVEHPKQILEAQSVESVIDQFATSNQIPISHQVCFDNF
jgi:hypothetical protein